MLIRCNGYAHGYYNNDNNDNSTDNHVGSPTTRHRSPTGLNVAVSFKPFVLSAPKAKFNRPHRIQVERAAVHESRGLGDLPRRHPDGIGETGGFMTGTTY